MKNLLIIFIPFLLACACTGLRVRKSELKPIDKNFSAVFNNSTFKTRGRKTDSTLLNLFEIQDAAKNISLKFNTQGQLQLDFAGNTRNLTFEGKFKKGFYQIYLRNEKRDFPPFFPIIYSNHDVYRLRLALTKNNTLLIDNKWEHTGSIFIMAGGGSGRAQYYFNPVENN